MGLLRGHKWSYNRDNESHQKVNLLKIDNRPLHDQYEPSQVQ